MAFSPYVSMQGANFALSIAGTASILPAGALNPIQNSIPPLNIGGPFNLGTGASQANVLGNYVILPQIPASGTATITLSNAVNDILNQTATIVRIKGFLLWLMSAIQNPTYGTAASQVVCGASGVNAWTGILNVNGTYTLNNGAAWAHIDQSAAGILVNVGSSDELLIKNVDSVNAAGVMMALFACSS
jgi:hypothetical protein